MKRILELLGPEAVEAARESRIRSAARRAGYRVSKSRRTGTFSVFELGSNIPAVADADLDQVDAWLAA